MAQPEQEEGTHKELHPLLQEFVDEHQAALETIEQFEAVVQATRAKGMDDDRVNLINEFYEFFGDCILGHNEREEQTVFLSLQRELLEREEFQESEKKRTAVELLHSDHIKELQLAAVSFNLFGLALRLPDPTSRLLTIDLAAEQAIELIELLKLHFSREEDIVFPMAQEYIAQDEFDAMYVPEKMS
ncbi:MAG TPA: hemerythrin domain-containing protein [Pirellulales bacterium]|jgi:hemerythrin-like domain-containing protein|nr:hemerythrin domain-containing protein [Pirellulales bacterium]